MTFPVTCLVTPMFSLNGHLQKIAGFAPYTKLLLIWRRKGIDLSSALVIFALQTVDIPGVETENLLGKRDLCYDDETDPTWPPTPVNTSVLKYLDTSCSGDIF